MHKNKPCKEFKGMVSLLGPQVSNFVNNFIVNETIENKLMPLADLRELLFENFIVSHKNVG